MFVFMLIGFIGGILFLGIIQLIVCAIVSRKWINADIEATNWDESGALVGQLELDGGQVIHSNMGCCGECQKHDASENPVNSS